MKKIFIIGLILASVGLQAQDTDWRLEPLRITASSKSATVYIICHMDLGKPITVYYDIYNSHDSLLCQYTMVTPKGEWGDDQERKGYLVGPDTLLLTDKWLTRTYGNHVSKLKQGDYVVAYGVNPLGIGSGTYTTERHLTFNIKSGKVVVSGNVMSLLVGDDPAQLDTAMYIPSSVCFARLFNQNGNNTSDEILQVMTGPVDASNLILPATYVPHAAYDRMFNSCTQLATLPELPATTVEDFGYLQMFGGCRGVKTPPVMAADTIGYMACRHMFQECVQMKKAPVFPARDLASAALGVMYEDCSRLCEIRVGFSSWTGSWGGSFSGDWVKGVAAKGTFYCPTALEWVFGTGYIPADWTVVTYDPAGVEKVVTQPREQQKRLINGQILIRRGDEWVDLWGRKW